MSENAQAEAAELVIQVNIEGKIVAVNIASGEVAWQQNIASANYVAVEICGARILVAAGKENMALHCLAYDTGIVHWKRDISKLASPPQVAREHRAVFDSDPMLFVHGDRIIINTAAGTSCYDWDGREQWHHSDSAFRYCEAIGVPGRTLNREPTR